MFAPTSIPVSQYYPATDNVKVITIGKNKITLTAFLTFLAGLVLAVILPFVGSYGIFLSIYVLLLFVLLAYNVNCAQVGHCHVWAWVLTLVYVGYVALAVVLIFTKKDLFKKVLSEKFSVRTRK